MRLLRAIAGTFLALLPLGAGSAEAASLQPIGKFEDPIYVTSDPGNANRLFVVERAGRIQQVENGVVQHLRRHPLSGRLLGHLHG